MKKVFNFLRSMRFGILLLVLIAALSVVGTVIPQGREISWYAQTYQSFHGTILLLRLNHVFESWYFIALLALLCLNLTLCSILRIRSVVRASKGESERAARVPDTVRLTPEGAEKLRAYLAAMRCRSEQVGDVTIWRKHSFGRYGTFITHLAILLTVIFGALALYTPVVTDRSCMPGEAITMPDGTEICVQDFRIEDETGRLDYTSHIQITLPNGRRSEVAELKVNHPFSFGPWKVFQQTFGTTGAVSAAYPDGKRELFYVSRGDLLQIDPDRLIAYRADNIGSGMRDIIMEAGKSREKRLSAAGPNFPRKFFGGRDAPEKDIQCLCHEPSGEGGFRPHRSRIDLRDGLLRANPLRQFSDVRDVNIQLCFFIPAQSLFSPLVF